MIPYVLAGYIMHNLESPESLNWGVFKMRLACTHVCWTLSWVLIDPVHYGQHSSEAGSWSVEEWRKLASRYIDFPWSWLQMCYNLLLDLLNFPWKYITLLLALLRCFFFFWSRVFVTAQKWNSNNTSQWIPLQSMLPQRYTPFFQLACSQWLTHAVIKNSTISPFGDNFR